MASVLEGVAADPPPRVDVAASVCGRAFHAGTPVCSGGDGCIGSRVTRSRSVCGGEKERERERVDEKDRQRED